MRFEPSQYSAVALPSHPRARSCDSGALRGSSEPAAASGCCSALRTIKLASAGLTALENALAGPMGTAFERALNLIVEATGRVIVTGMGKSGHIGAKIA